MCAIHVAELGSTGSPAMDRFQSLSAGNTGQPATVGDDALEGGGAVLGVALSTVVTSAGLLALSRDDSVTYTLLAAVSLTTNDTRVAPAASWAFTYAVTSQLRAAAVASTVTTVSAVLPAAGRLFQVIPLSDHATSATGKMPMRTLVPGSDWPYRRTWALAR